MSSQEDITVLLHSTGVLRAYTFKSAAFIKQDEMLSNYMTWIITQMLNPTMNESAALHLGYLIIHYFEKLSPKIDTDILQGVLHKILRSKVPSIVQGLVTVFARLIHKYTKPILDFLQDASVENRPGFKVLLDKWLIH